MGIKGQGHSLIAQISNLKLVFLIKKVESFEIKVHMKAYGRMGMKMYTNTLVT